ncbi:putative cytochrome P450 [Xylaria sp. FL1777]|nr:putative cytochrome P450 [Xylaria sp. FL1777]
MAIRVLKEIPIELPAFSVPVSTWAIIVCLICILYLRALPQPIPDIPYNKRSAHRLLGDIPEVAALQKAGESPIKFWSNLAKIHHSPITQYFLPFSKPIVVISDFREAQDLNLRRGKDLGRGWINSQTWNGVLPDHFIAMENFDARYKGTKTLVKDLMTPTFLHEINALESYNKVSAFMELWKVKASIARSHSFDAYQDLGSLTFDIMMSAAFGTENEESETFRHFNDVRAASLSQTSISDIDTIFPFPKTELDELHKILDKLVEAAGASFKTPSPWLFHKINNLTPSMLRAYSSRRNILRSFIDRSIQRLNREGKHFTRKSAVDFVVARETAAAQSLDQQPVFDSPQLLDALFGYLVGGQDSTHSTLMFMVKYLGREQETQAKLRAFLKNAYIEDHKMGKQPSMKNILTTKIPYLDAFIQELLRLANPSVAVAKETLCDMHILGYLVPKGTVLIFPISGLTMHEKGCKIDERLRSKTSQAHSSDGLGDWGDSEYPAYEFHPERWLRDAENNGDFVFEPNAGPFLTFSTGTRTCWGKRLAYLELKLITTLLVWNFVFEPLPGGLDDDLKEYELFTKPRTCYVKLNCT